MLRVASPCASIEIRSNSAAASARSFHSSPKVLAHLASSSAMRSASRMHHGVRASDIGDRDIGPAGQLAPIFPGEIEQRRQHHGGELGRDPVDPVEGLVARQAVEHVGRCACGSAPRKLARLVGATIGATVLRCAVWPGGSMRMKLGSSWPLGWSVDLDAAELGGRRIGRVVELDRADVVVARHRPIRPER